MTSDAFIRHNVAQPAIDRLEVDPCATARSLDRFRVIGGVIGLGRLMSPGRQA